MQLELEAKKKKEDTEFKAHPASVLQKEPFMPQIPIRPLLTIDNIMLYSEVRENDRKSSVTSAEGCRGKQRAS